MSDAIADRTSFGRDAGRVAPRGAPNSSGQGTLEYYLKRENNSFEIIRLVLALMVVWGHACGSHDFLYRATGHHMAAIAVKGFFFLSGLLVTHSLLRSKSPRDFVIHRIFRIWPGLLAVAAVTALVVGPLFTSVPLEDYFKGGAPWLYIFRMGTLQTWGTQAQGYHGLPSMFGGQIVDNIVNPPLWTLAPEVFAYAALLSCYLLSSGRRVFIMIGALIIIADSLLPERVILFWLPFASEDLSMLGFSFAFGVVSACLSHHARIDGWVLAGALVMYLLFFRKPSIYNEVSFLVMTFIAIIYIGSLPKLSKLKPAADISYGVYLYGFLVQRIMTVFWPRHDDRFFATICLALSCIVGAVSWTLIEKHGIAMGKIFISHLNGRAKRLIKQP